MTLTEIKLDCFDRSIMIMEFNDKCDGIPGISVCIAAKKVDTDGTEITASKNITHNEYRDINTQKSTVREAVQMLENLITMRHAGNPDTCEHKLFTLANGKTVCSNCMGTFGVKFTKEAGKFSIN